MTRSLSGQHAEGSNREETGSWSFARETNGLLSSSSLIVKWEVWDSPAGPELPLGTLVPHLVFVLFPSLALDLSDISSLGTETLSSAPARPLIMTKPYFA